ncbi:type II toxin-antitoxin system RelE/ParE family toxin [Hyphomicrobium sp.]|uniref:type II toxin-antitoxin system RelE/ParE family toxin n=1 Tax=Hyphomicrobium sp. TaxID=82 RepID=UPI0025BE3811|nr:type II toxin-antitoxin system RelE/ParE family toxin [Hyphomicrobium sp.]MCC7253055.1 type II toxin-antitoxin system RelE/ParE family toxin [Hyphomicrobium sp.]
MKVVVTPSARADLRAIHNYIAVDNPPAAKRTLARIRRAVESLGTFPELGRAWEGGPTRALSIAGIPYRIHYRVREDELQVLHVYHTARMPPDISGE